MSFELKKKAISESWKSLNKIEKPYFGIFVQALNKKMIDSCLGLSSELTKFPAEQIWVDYDKEADVLYLSFRKPQRAKKTVELEDDVLIRTDNDNIVGITILNASSR